jgi:hypothetical protein
VFIVPSTNTWVRRWVGVRAANICTVDEILLVEEKQN